MIKFGMSTTFIQFKDQYWLYGGGLAVDEKGLTIGGYEHLIIERGAPWRRAREDNPSSLNPYSSNCSYSYSYDII